MAEPRSVVPRAVVDTSVLLSEHRHWVWLLAHLGHFEGVWSTFIVGELIRIRVLHSLDRNPAIDRGVLHERLNALVNAFSEVLEVADYSALPALDILRDRDDEPILRAALVAGADFIVSLNTHDFPAGGLLGGVRFVTPQEFVVILGARRPEAARAAREAGRKVP